MPNPLDPRPIKRGRPLGSTNKKTLSAESPPLAPFKNGQKQNDGRFKKGWAGGPGRPQGSRNKASLIIQHLGEEAVNQNSIKAYKHILALAFGEADKGDVAACKYIYETTCPPRKGTRVDLGYEDSIRVSTEKDVNEISRKVTQDMLEGLISVEEAEGLCKVLDHRLKILTDVDLLKKIEETCTKVDSLYTDK